MCWCVGGGVIRVWEFWGVFIYLLFWGFIRVLFLFVSMLFWLWFVHGGIHSYIYSRLSGWFMFIRIGSKSTFTLTLNNSSFLIYSTS